MFVVRLSFLGGGEGFCCAAALEDVVGGLGARVGLPKELLWGVSALWFVPGSVAGADGENI